MKKEDSYARCVRHAAGLVGGPEKLAGRLGVDLELVSTWTDGRSVPTARHFSHIVDIIVGKTTAKAVAE